MHYLRLIHRVCHLIDSLANLPNVFVTGNVGTLTFFGGAIKSLVTNIRLDIVTRDVLVDRGKRNPLDDLLGGYMYGIVQ